MYADDYNDNRKCDTKLDEEFFHVKSIGPGCFLGNAGYIKSFL